MSDADARDPMDSFERELADSLRRRAEGVPAAPLGFTDVQRRIVQRRRRTATMAAAAVTLPAVIGLGFLAGRNTGDERIASDAVVFGETTLPGLLPSTTFPNVVPTTTTIVGEFMPAGSTFRCQGPPITADEVWQYYGYCEYVRSETPYDPGLVPRTTTSMPSAEPFPTTTIPPTTNGGSGSTIDPAELAEQVLVVDASGGTSSMSAVAAQLGAPLKYAVVATRPFEATVVMPLGADVTAAFALLDRFGVGGFDTWTPDLISDLVPEGVTVVLVIGQYGPQGWTP